MRWAVSAIAEKIVANQADYVIALKSNQRRLYESVVQYFKDWEGQSNSLLFQRYVAQYEDVDAGHGSVEVRNCCLSPCLDTLPNPDH